MVKGTSSSPPTITLGLPPWPKGAAKDRRDRKSRSMSRALLKVASAMLKGHHGSDPPKAIEKFLEPSRVDRGAPLSQGFVGDSRDFQ